MEKSLCPVCNTKLKAAPKEQLSGELRKTRSLIMKTFGNAQIAAQVYWQGAHWKQISNTLKEAQAKLEKLKEKN